jgi:hypothetical protein
MQHHQHGVIDDIDTGSLGHIQDRGQEQLRHLQGFEHPADPWTIGNTHHTQPNRPSRLQKLGQLVWCAQLHEAWPSRIKADGTELAWRTATMHEQVAGNTGGPLLKPSGAQSTRGRSQHGWESSSQ